MGVVKTEVLVVAGVALALIYLAKKAADTTVELVKDGANAVNPFNEKNVFNEAATSLWQMSTGSKGNLGTDFYDYMHRGDLLPDGTLLNYTPEQAAADAKATAQLELGYHGM